jgi:hypothetical protein
MVASVDGYTEEYPLRLKKEGLPGQRRITSSDSSWKSGKGVPFWAPWAQSEGYSGDRGNRQPKQQPKTLFDLLFK